MKRTLIAMSTVVLAVLLVSCHPGHHNYYIERVFQTEFEEQLILVAEAIDPNREAVLVVFDGDTSDLPAEGLWWYRDFDTVRILYAITGDAIEYYVGLVEMWGERGIDEYADIFWRRSELTYRADVESMASFTIDGQTFENLYVVSMRLEWYAYCGTVCAHFFEKERTVVFSEEGTLLAVFGDGETRLGIS